MAKSLQNCKINDKLFAGNLPPTPIAQLAPWEVSGVFWMPWLGCSASLKMIGSLHKSHSGVKGYLTYIDLYNNILIYQYIGYFIFAPFY